MFIIRFECLFCQINNDDNNNVSALLLGRWKPLLVKKNFMADSMPVALLGTGITSKLVLFEVGELICVKRLVQSLRFPRTLLHH